MTPDTAKIQDAERVKCANYEKNHQANFRGHRVKQKK
jgi:hypothetical protein